MSSFFSASTLMGFSSGNRNADTIMKLTEYDGSKHKLDSLSSDITRLYDDFKDKIKLVAPLKIFCLKALEGGNQFTKAHITFLKVVIQSRCYKQAIEVLEWPFIQTGEMKSDEILEYLYYGGIIWTVLEQYKSAAQFFGFISRIQSKQSNMKIDAQKKLNILKLLLGQRVSDREHSMQYIPIINKLERGEDITKDEQKTLKEDGNWPLVIKLRHTLLLKELTYMASIYNRIPIKDLNPIFSAPETISRLNKLQHTYRYDPRSECLIFEGKKTDLEKTISKTVKTYLEVLVQEKNIKASQKLDRQFRY